jgi:hypothetical protein
MSITHYRSALTTVLNFLDELDALLISLRPDDYAKNGYITIPPQDDKYYDVCVRRKTLWNTHTWLKQKVEIYDDVDETQQKLKMRDLYRSIFEIDLHKLAYGSGRFKTIAAVKTEALSALETWFTEKGFTTWFEENRYAEEDKPVAVVLVSVVEHSYVEEVKDRLLSLYLQLKDGCSDSKKILDVCTKLVSEGLELLMPEAYSGLQNGCTETERSSDAYTKVRACVEVFWWEKKGSNTPIWQHGWRKLNMPDDEALRIIGEEVRPRLETAAKETAGIKNWKLRELIGTELAYIIAKWPAPAGQATKQQMESEKINMRMQNLPSMLDKTEASLLTRLNRILAE